MKTTNKANWTGNIPTSSNSGTTSSNAITINADLALVTTESLSTAANASTTITLTNSKIVAGTTVRASLVDYAGTFGTNGTPVVCVDGINTGAGTALLIVSNAHDANALSGAVKILVEVVTLV